MSVEGNRRVQVSQALRECMQVIPAEIQDNEPAYDPELCRRGRVLAKAFLAHERKPLPGANVHDFAYEDLSGSFRP